MNEFLLWLQAALQDYSLALALMLLFFVIFVFAGVITMIAIYFKIQDMFLDYQFLYARHNKEEKKKCQNKQ